MPVDLGGAHERAVHIRVALECVASCDCDDPVDDRIGVLFVLKGEWDMRASTEVQVALAGRELESDHGGGLVQGNDEDSVTAQDGGRTGNTGECLVDLADKESA
ncbi:hypothetical protein [Luteimicrobium xylanilyticum]|uniref:hypothetical protein n=1 Tax=Luteimicrobium xylanilyticum TaxID=1133546 RepID=UPI00128FD042|nr:hypothetical protein [Luteimicrobium xylanilyticum]